MSSNKDSSTPRVCPGEAPKVTGLQGSYGFSKFRPIVESLEMLAECGQPNPGVCVLNSSIVYSIFLPSHTPHCRKLRERHTLHCGKHQ